MNKTKQKTKKEVIRPQQLATEVRELIQYFINKKTGRTDTLIILEHTKKTLNDHDIITTILNQEKITHKQHEQKQAKDNNKLEKYFAGVG